MVPSPDWIVGLSKENLCLANCSWVDNRVIDLYPWDIGTDSGLRYDGDSSPQRPKGVIRRITSSDPHSDESPFYDNTGRNNFNLIEKEIRHDFEIRCSNETCC